MKTTSPVGRNDLGTIKTCLTCANEMIWIGSYISANDYKALPSPVSPPVRPEAEALKSSPKIYHTSLNHINHCAVYEISPKQDIWVKVVRGITKITHH